MLFCKVLLLWDRAQDMLIWGRRYSVPIRVDHPCLTTLIGIISNCIITVYFYICTQRNLVFCLLSNQSAHRWSDILCGDISDILCFPNGCYDSQVSCKRHSPSFTWRYKIGRIEIERVKLTSIDPLSGIYWVSLMHRCTFPLEWVWHINSWDCIFPAWKINLFVFG